MIDLRRAAPVLRSLTEDRKDLVRQSFEEGLTERVRHDFASGQLLKQLLRTHSGAVLQAIQCSPQSLSDPPQFHRLSDWPICGAPLSKATQACPVYQVSSAFKGADLKRLALAASPEFLGCASAPESVSSPSNFSTSNCFAASIIASYSGGSRADAAMVAA